MGYGQDIIYEPDNDTSNLRTVTFSKMIPKLLQFVFIAVSYATGAASKPFITTRNYSKTCTSMVAPTVPGVRVIDFTAHEYLNRSGIAVNESTPALIQVEGLAICELNVTLRHPGAPNDLFIQAWLPLEGWNGRFQAIGGGGWVAGMPGSQNMALPIQAGWAAAITTGGEISSTDGQLSQDILSDTREIDFARLQDFASRSLHDLALVGKSLTGAFYGTEDFKAYWQGCSQGGRQGYQLAQQYPDDFDGILANAPAINFPDVIMNLAWPQFVMRNANHSPSSCVASALHKAAVQQCDGLDGVVDGVISDPWSCHFDPFSLVGTQVQCETNTTTRFSEIDAAVLQTIQSGPSSLRGRSLFPAWPWGINYTTIVATEPSNLWNNYIKLLLAEDPNFAISDFTTVEEYTEFFGISASRIHPIIGAGSIDLSKFRDLGGKLLTWHGLADEMIPVNNTINYRRKVEDFMGGSELVNEFYRFFPAPGVAHCLFGDGAYPADAMDALVSWVEEGKAPSNLHGRNRAAPHGERILCPWPQVASYDGIGDPNEAGSFACKES